MSLKRNYSTFSGDNYDSKKVYGPIVASCGHMLIAEVESEDASTYGELPCDTCKNFECVICEDLFPFNNIKYSQCFKCKVCPKCLEEVFREIKEKELTHCAQCGGLYLPIEQGVAPQPAPRDERERTPKHIINDSLNNLHRHSRLFNQHAEQVKLEVAKDLNNAEKVVEHFKNLKSKLEKDLLATSKRLTGEIVAYSEGYTSLNQAIGIDKSIYATPYQKDCARSYLKSLNANYKEMYPNVGDTYDLPYYRFDPVVMPVVSKLPSATDGTLINADLDLDESKFTTPMFVHDIKETIARLEIQNNGSLIIVPTYGSHFIYLCVNSGSSLLYSIGSDDRRLEVSKLPAFQASPVVERIFGPNANYNKLCDTFDPQCSYYNSNGYLVLGGRRRDRQNHTHHFLNNFEIRNNKGRLIHLNCGKYSIHQIDAERFEIKGPFSSFVYTQPNFRTLMNQTGYDYVDEPYNEVLMLNTASVFDNRALLKYNYGPAVMLFLVEPPENDGAIRASSVITKYFLGAQTNEQYVLVSREHVMKVSLESEWLLELMEIVNTPAGIAKNQLIPLFKVRNPYRQQRLKLMDAYVGLNNTFVVRTDKFTLVY